MKGLSLLVAILVTGCLAAGCGSTVKSAINNLPSKTATRPVTPGATTTPGTTSTTPTPTAVPPTATTTVTATAAPSTAGAATASPGGAASGNGSGTSLLWLWILLGVLVLATLVAWITRSGRRRSAVAADWQSRLIDAYAKGSALHDAMSVAEVQVDPAIGDARARWYDIQRRADDLAQTLYALSEAAPDPSDQARIADVLASLQAVRSAMDAERAPGGTGPQLAEVVRSRLSAFELSLRALRAGDQEFS